MIEGRCPLLACEVYPKEGTHTAVTSATVLGHAVSCSSGCLAGSRSLDAFSPHFWVCLQAFLFAGTALTLAGMSA